MLDFNEIIVYFKILYLSIALAYLPLNFFIGFDDKAFVYDNISISYYLLFTCDTTTLQPQEKQTKIKNYFYSKFAFCNRFSTGS